LSLARLCIIWTSNELSRKVCSRINDRNLAWIVEIRLRSVYSAIVCSQSFQFANHSTKVLTWSRNSVWCAGFMSLAKDKPFAESRLLGYAYELVLMSAWAWALSYGYVEQDILGHWTKEFSLRLVNQNFPRKCALSAKSFWSPWELSQSLRQLPRCSCGFASKYQFSNFLLSLLTSPWNETKSGIIKSCLNGISLGHNVDPFFRLYKIPCEYYDWY